MKEHIVIKYRHTVLFYLLATLIPWVFWFAASYVSHHVVYSESTWTAPLLGLAGLCFPMILTIMLVSRHQDLRKDFLGRFLNLSFDKWQYYLTACLLMPASILCAMAISLLFGYSPSQFIITGHYTFTSGVFPVWFLLILAPILEELAWLYSLNFIVSIFPFVFLMNWLYYKTNRNILVAIIFHITAGYFNEIFSTHPDSKCIQTILLLIVSIIVVLKDCQLFFKRALA